MFIADGLAVMWHKNDHVESSFFPSGGQARMKFDEVSQENKGPYATVMYDPDGFEVMYYGGRHVSKVMQEHWKSMAKEVVIAKASTPGSSVGTAAALPAVASVPASALTASPDTVRGPVKRIGVGVGDGILGLVFVLESGSRLGRFKSTSGREIDIRDDDALWQSGGVKWHHLYKACMY